MIAQLQATAGESKERSLEDYQNDVRPPEDFAEYDAKWLNRYRALSFMMALFTAVATATFFGMFGRASAMLLDKASGKDVPFHKSRTPVAVGAMMGLGVVFAYFSTKNEATRQKLGDDRLAHRIVAGKQATGKPAAAAPDAAVPSPQMPHVEEKNRPAQWRDLVMAGRTPQAAAGFTR